ETWKRLPEFATLELDIIQVKGKKIGLHVYALMGDPELAKRPDFVKAKETVDTMLAAYRSQQWDKAEALIKELRVIGEPFHLDYLCELYEGRIAAYRIDPPPADWDGVFIATSK
ncbi:MAG TPA: hypothetical protein VGA59_02035, partial [Ramlibacter sp.]